MDPLKDVEAVGKKLGFTLDRGNFHNVSLGQVGPILLDIYLGVSAVSSD